jgi:hypothetical protein
MRGGVMQISLGAPGGGWLKICGAAWEVRRQVAGGCVKFGCAPARSGPIGGDWRRAVGRSSLKGQ